jgi:hypothetical protein
LLYEPYDRLPPSSVEVLGFLYTISVDNIVLRQREIVAIDLVGKLDFAMRSEFFVVVGVVGYPLLNFPSILVDSFPSRVLITGIMGRWRDLFGLSFVMRWRAIFGVTLPVGRRINRPFGLSFVMRWRAIFGVTVVAARR